MYRYFATFISGTSAIIAERLRAMPNAQLRVLEMQDGLVLFESNLRVGQLGELRFFNHVYRLIADLGTQDSIDAAAELAAKSPIPDAPNGNFRVMARLANKPVSTQHLATLQNAIVQATGAKVDSYKPQCEYLLLLRADGRCLWG